MCSLGLSLFFEKNAEPSKKGISLELKFCLIISKCEIKHFVTNTNQSKSLYFNKLLTLALNDEYTRSGNLIFFMVLTPKTTPRSFVTHAPGNSLISTDALSQKIANFIKNGWQLKG